MAEATSTTVRVVTLTLTDDEAAFLRQILASVGGHPQTSQRRHEVSISRALGKLGYSFKSINDPDFPLSPNSRSLVFLDDESVIVPSPDPWASTLPDSDEPPF